MHLNGQRQCIPVPLEELSHENDLIYGFRSVGWMISALLFTSLRFQMDLQSKVPSFFMGKRDFFIGSQGELQLTRKSDSINCAIWTAILIFASRVIGCYFFLFLFLFSWGGGWGINELV